MSVEKKFKYIYLTFGIALLMSVSFLLIRIAAKPSHRVDVIRGTLVSADLQKDFNPYGYYEVDVSMLGGDIKAITVDAYDSLHNHTGLNPGSPMIGTDIPNSDWSVFGDQIYVMLDASDNYAIQLTGVANGTLKLGIKSNNREFSYPDIVVSPSFLATVVLPRGGVETAPVLQVYRR